jgi:hypothetical protein
MCLGKNGGYLQIGGFDGKGHLDKDIQWTRLKDSHNFLVSLHGISMNDHLMQGSDLYTEGFIDSGSTFAYFPKALFTSIKQHFEQWFCPASELNCLGKPS